MVADMIETLTRYCTRLYARNRAQKALPCAMAWVGPGSLGEEAALP
jgi:hypothetical protein